MNEIFIDFYVEFAQQIHKIFDYEMIRNINSLDCIVQIQRHCIYNIYVNLR